MSPGKRQRLAKLCGSDGIIAALAVDQRGTLRRALAEAKGVSEEAVAADMAVFKTAVTRILGPQATAVLLDVDYGMPAIAVHDRRVGLLLAYEKWGYDRSRPGRMQETLDGWTVARLVEAGADSIKILLFYTPFEQEEINTCKRRWVKRIGDECRTNDVPFCLEPLVYDPTGAGEASAAFAAVKPRAVAGCIEVFSRPEFGVDLLKVEVPVNISYVEGTRAHRGGRVVCTRSEALDAYRRAAEAARVPFVYLSAGVDHDVFLESLELAAEAGVAFNGVLCGRATWKDAIPAYAQHGLPALEAWLHDQGTRNIQALNALLAQTASPCA